MRWIRSCASCASLFALAFLPGCSDDGDAPPGPVLKDVTAAEARDLVEQRKSDPAFVILDVRTPAEFIQERIEGAVNIDYYSSTFAEDLDALDGSKTYLVHCRSGARSAAASAMMEDLGFRVVYNLAGGIDGWKLEGCPTVSG
jgi:rhodanese-related sulfurtransferase